MLDLGPEAFGAGLHRRGDAELRGGGGVGRQGRNALGDAAGRPGKLLARHAPLDEAEPLRLVALEGLRSQDQAQGTEAVRTGG